MEWVKIKTIIENITGYNVDNKCRKSKAVESKRLFCYFSRLYTDLTLEEIALITETSHSNVLYHVRLVSDRLSINDEEMKLTIRKIECRLKEKDLAELKRAAKDLINNSLDANKIKKTIEILKEN